jgi:hypothetical protein
MKDMFVGRLWVGGTVPKIDPPHPKVQWVCSPASDNPLWVASGTDAIDNALYNLKGGMGTTNHDQARFYCHSETPFVIVTPVRPPT